LNGFDPIGVADAVDDEYDSYVGPMLRLCEESKPSDDLRNYVEWVVYDHMALSRTPQRQQAIGEFVEKFCGWYGTSWPDTVV
jgi:hypothetical protein